HAALFLPFPTRRSSDLPWIVPSAVVQIYGGLVASALAALDDYAWAAVGFAAGSIAGVVLTLALVGHGVVAFGWGLATTPCPTSRSEEHTSELQSQSNLV